MITFPPEFVLTKYPGYVWNIQTKQLYSFKTGVLKLVKKNKPSRFFRYFDGYRISHEGQRRDLPMSDLLKLTQGDSVISIIEDNE